MGIDQLASGGDVPDDLVVDSLDTESSRTTQNVDQIGTDSFEIITDFISGDGLDTFTQNGASTPLSSRGQILRLDSQINSEALARMDKQHLRSELLSYDNDWRFRAFLSADDVSQQIVVGVGNPSFGSLSPSFEIESGTIYGTADNYREQIQSVSANTDLDLYLEYDSGSEIRYYVNDTPPATPDLTITSNLPTGSVSDYFYGARANSPDGIAFDVDLMRLAGVVLP